MATYRRVFTLRLKEELFDKIQGLADKEHRSMTNYIEYILLEYIRNFAENKDLVSAQKAETTK